MRGSKGETDSCVAPHTKSSLLERSRRRHHVPTTQSPFRKAWEVGKPRGGEAQADVSWLVHPRPGRLRAGAGNGSATRARRPRWQLEGPRGRRETPEGPGHPSLARSAARSFAHFTTSRGGASPPPPVSLARFPAGPAVPHPPPQYLPQTREPPRSQTCYLGLAPTCPASWTAQGERVSGGVRGNSGSNQRKPELHSCARPDWAALRIDLPPMAAGPERTEGTFRSVKLGRASRKVEGGEEKRGGWGRGPWLIGRKAAEAAAPLADTGAGRGAGHLPAPPPMGLVFGLAVKTPKGWEFVAGVGSRFQDSMKKQSFVSRPKF